MVSSPCLVGPLVWILVRYRYSKIGGLLLQTCPQQISRFLPKRDAKTEVPTADGVERKWLYMTHKPSYAARNASSVSMMQARSTPGLREQSGVLNGRQLADRLSIRNRKVRTRPRFRQMGFGGNRRLVEGQGGLAHLRDSTKFQSMREYCAIRRAVPGESTIPRTPLVVTVKNSTLCSRT